MPTLGDLLSEFSDIRAPKMFVEPGVVFKIFDRKTTPPKWKRHVIVGVCEDEILVGTVRINSTMNVNVYREQEKQYRCLKLKKEVYSFLDYDSVIDCNNLIPSNLNGVKKHFCASPSCVLGKLRVEDVEEIKLRMVDAPTISKADKIKFGIIQK
ncbi:hypothetical protein [uncultured Butyricimonas sp.]|uniref:hypothetical protein n=1 Tax=uncultured Butyricimonas sp. TaxID=1268785 RepID=UPI0026DBAF53|nr:hypothetical protein [uncultured Butyricimonas sp.]